MLIGYARVSTLVQSVDLQSDALKAIGCGDIFTDTISGAKVERKGLADALSHLRPGDTLVVWRLDRLGRTLPHLIQTVEDLRAKGIGFRSLTESIDTTTNAGELIFHIFGALAQFERNLIRERTQAGLAAARARGRTGGRRPKLTSTQIAMGQALYDSRKHTVAEICEHLGCSPATFYRYVKTGHAQGAAI